VGAAEAAVAAEVWVGRGLSLHYKLELACCGVSVGGGIFGLRWRRGDGLFGAAFACYEDTNAFDHLGSGAGAFRQEDVSVEGTVEGVDSAGDNHCGKAGVQLFGAANQFVAVHLRHEEIAEDQVDGAGEGAFENLQGFLCTIDCNYAVATSVEQEGADRENLFIVVYAENRLLGAHAVSLLPDATLWWLAADGPVWRVCWFAGMPVWWCSKLPRGPAGCGRSARDGSPAPEEQKTGRAKLSRLFHWGSATSVRRARLPNRGVREKPYAGAGCHAAP
jgi:hypothetical protein